MNRSKPSVVTSVQEQTSQAAELAAIEGQARLADPRSNPAVRGHADRLRDQQHRRVLDAEHTRLIRRYRVADQRAANAEKTLEAIQAAQATMSPARSVIALHNGRSKFLGVAMAASLTLSAGSAMGVAHLAAQLGAPEAAGYIAEVGLTGLSTASILYRSHLAQHGGDVDGWQSKVLWALMVVPLLASITANAISTGAVGVFCSIGAAAFSLLSAVISDRSAATLRARAAEVTDDDLAGLQAVAMGDGLGEDLLTVQATTAPETTQDAGGVDPEEGTESALPVEDDQAEDDQAEDDQADDDQGGEGELDWVRELVERGEAELEAWLDEVDGDDSEPVPPVSGPGSGPQRTVSPRPAAEPDWVAMRPRVHIDADQADPSAPADSAHRVLPATQARIAMGASTRQQVAAYLSDHPDASVEEIRQALGLGRTTVKRHRRELRELREGGGRS